MLWHIERGVKEKIAFEYQVLWVELCYLVPTKDGPTFLFPSFGPQCTVLVRSISWVFYDFIFARAYPSPWSDPIV